MNISAAGVSMTTSVLQSRVETRDLKVLRPLDPPNVSMESSVGRSPVEVSLRWEAAQSRQAAATFPGQGLFRTVVWLLGASSVLGSTCDSATQTSLSAGFNTRIGNTGALLLNPPTAYAPKLTTADGTLHTDMAAFMTAMDTCIATPAGAGQFANLQACSQSVFSSVSAYQSPLNGLQTELDSTFAGNYQSLSATSSQIVGYTTASFAPLTGSNGVYEMAKLDYKNACDLDYSGMPIANQTVEAQTANTQFLVRIDGGFTPVETVFENSVLNFVPSFVTALNGCRNGASVADISGCLTTQKSVLTTESNRLYGIVGQLSDAVNGFSTTTTELDNFANSALLSYQSVCAQVDTIDQATTACLAISDAPIMAPTGSPTSLPTGLPTGNPSAAAHIQYINTVEKDCVGMSPMAFGTIMTAAGVVFGSLLGFLAGRKYESNQLPKILEKEAADQHPPLEMEDLTTTVVEEAKV